MDFNTNETDCLLANLRNGIDQVLCCPKKEVGKEDPLVLSVGEVLSHHLTQPKPGYWHIVRELTHPSTRSYLARLLKHVNSPYERGQFWIYFTLIEGSLSSYLQVLVNESSLLKKYYKESALLRNPYSATKFVLSISSLSEHTFAPLEPFSQCSKDRNLKEIDKYVLDNVACEDPSKKLSDECGSLTDSLVEELGFVITKLSDFVGNTNDNKAEKEMFSRIENGLPINRDWNSFEDCQLSSVGEDNVVVRRPKKAGKEKRVSFHEDVCTKSPDARPIRERHSVSGDEYWGEETFLSQLFSKFGMADEAGDLEKGSEAGLFLAPSPLPSERGVPEGEEDPHRSEENLLSSPLKRPKPAQAGRAELREKLLRRSLPPKLCKPSKAPLLRRFLNSIDHQRMSDEVKGKLKSKRKGRFVYLPKVTPDEELIRRGNKEIEDELARGLKERLSELPIVDKAHSNKGLPSGCQLNKTFLMCREDGAAVLIVLYHDRVLLESNASSKSYAYSSILSILVGPNSSSISFLLSDNSSQLFIPVDGTVNPVCCALDMIVNFRAKPTPARLLCFVELSQEDLGWPRKAVKLAIGENQIPLHSCWAWVSAWNPEVPDDPLEKDSMLMVCWGRSSKWCPAVVRLRGSLFEVRSEILHKIHHLSKCVAVERVASSRPHTCVVKFSDKQSIILATPDEYELSEWMQCLLLGASSKGNEATKPPQVVRQVSASFVNILLTESYLISVKPSDGGLGSVRLSNISSISNSKSFCILELECIEVNGINGDWVLHFPSVQAKSIFLERLFDINSELKKLVVPCQSPKAAWTEFAGEIQNSFDGIFLP